MRHTGIYRTTNATLEQETKLRKAIKEKIKNGFKNLAGEKPYAVAYGVVDKNGNKKLFKNCPVFYHDYAFENYIISKRQTVLAVYNHN